MIRVSFFLVDEDEDDPLVTHYNQQYSVRAAGKVEQQFKKE